MHAYRYASALSPVLSVVATCLLDGRHFAISHHEPHMDGYASIEFVVSW